MTTLLRSRPLRLDELSEADVPFRTGHFLAYAPKDFHRIAYVDWGDPESRRVVICVHGLSRQGRDFDPLAYALAKMGYRVICPDLPGRGLSGWLRDPELYALPQYAADMAALIAHLNLKGEIDWIGTSLGGLTGMVLASAQDTPIRRLVINDIGPGALPVRRQRPACPRARPGWPAGRSPACPAPWSRTPPARPPR